MSALAFLIAAILGLLTAAIASSKGRSFGLWLIYGFLLAIVALPHALIMKPDRAMIDQRREMAGDRKCPHCAEMIRREAIVCRFCGRDVEPAAERVIETY